MLFRVKAEIQLKTGVFDPAAAQIQKTLVGMGFETAASVVQGKTIEVTIECADEGLAREQGMKMCQDLLANPVMEKFEIVSIRPG